MLPSMYLHVTALSGGQVALGGHVQSTSTSLHMLPLNVRDAMLLSTATVSLTVASSAEFVVTPLFMPEADYRTVEQQGVLVTVCWLVSGQARLLLECVHPLCWLVSPISHSWTLCFIAIVTVTNVVHMRMWCVRTCVQAPSGE